MDLVRNPYTPAAGRRPPELVGRDRELEEMRVLIERAKGGTIGRSMVLYGLRGVGTTVLLQELHRLAHDAGWLTAQVEGSRMPGAAARAATALARDLLASARGLHRRHERVTAALRKGLGTIASFSINLGVSGVELGFERQAGRADSGDIGLDLQELLEDAADALREQGIGIAVFADEMQDLGGELLASLLTAQHRAAQRDIPFYVVGAGLPGIPGVLAESNSYAERQFDYRLVDKLSERDALQALVAPAEARGVTWRDRAARRLVEISDGYPYFIQVFGDQAWRLSPGPDITSRDVVQAEAAGAEALDDGFFATRWQRATDAERRFMRAMAAFGDRSVASEVMTRMGMPGTSPGPYRRTLIHKGLVYSPDRGQVAFTVPHMAQYITRRGEE